MLVARPNFEHVQPIKMMKLLSLLLEFMSPFKFVCSKDLNTTLDYREFFHLVMTWRKIIPGVIPVASFELPQKLLSQLLLYSSNSWRASHGFIGITNCCQDRILV